MGEIFSNAAAAEWEEAGEREKNANRLGKYIAYGTRKYNMVLPFH